MARVKMALSGKYLRKSVLRKVGLNPMELVIARLVYVTLRAVPQVSNLETLRSGVLFRVG
jgi:hypothetical protein